MRIMVTGGCGFVGTKLTGKLLDEGHEVIVLDNMWFGNFLNENKNLTLIKEDIRNCTNINMNNIDTVIHLANIANDPCGDLNSKTTWEVNVLSTKFIIEKAISCNVKHFIFASSGSVYGIKDEEQVTEDLSLVPISDYNKTKMISERVLLSYKDEIPISIIRPATICGFSLKMRLDLSVNLLTMLALKNKKITVFGGSQIRPNIHIDDMIGVYLHFLKNGDKLQGIYNAGFENISILDIANKIVDKIPSEIVISKSDDPRSYRLNSDKLLNTGFKPIKKVDDAVQELCDLYKKGILKDNECFYNVKWMKKHNYS